MAEEKKTKTFHRVRAFLDGDTDRAPYFTADYGEVEEVGEAMRRWINFGFWDYNDPSGSGLYVPATMLESRFTFEVERYEKEG